MQCIILNKKNFIDGKDQHLDFIDEKIEAQGGDVITYSLHMWQSKHLTLSTLKTTNKDF